MREVVRADERGIRRARRARRASAFAAAARGVHAVTWPRDEDTVRPRAAQIEARNGAKVGTRKPRGIDLAVPIMTFGYCFAVSVRGAG